MLTLLLLACTTASITIDGGDVVASQPGSDDLQFRPNQTLPGGVQSNCDGQEYGLGLTLFDLPPGMPFHVSVLDDGSILYEEEIVADACGTATPFEDVLIDDIGGFNDPSNVYVKSPEAAGYVLYVGQLLDDDMNVPFPISTQWDVEASTEDTWVPISDDEFGILVGPFMVL